MFVITQFNSASQPAHQEYLQFRHVQPWFCWDTGMPSLPLQRSVVPGHRRCRPPVFAPSRTASSRLYPHLVRRPAVSDGLQRWYHYHIEKDADLTIATIPVVDKDAPGFGIMKVNEQGISKISSKTKPEVLGEWQSHVDEKYRNQGNHYLASMGIYFQPDVPAQTV